jgi:5'-nucleotidase
MYQETVYNDPVETTQEMVHIEKRAAMWCCDLFISLSIIINDPSKICDVKLAEFNKDIDLIIGGIPYILDKPTVMKT